MHIRGLNRWQAFGVHFGLSVLIFLALLAIIVFVWYPGVFIQMGGWQGIRIVAGVDLVLGPLLTLIVFNPAKKSLPFDLTIIGLLQVGCLGYGIWIVEGQRPMAQVFAHDGVYVLAKADYIDYEVEWDLLADYPGQYPKTVFLKLPDNKEQMITTAVAASITSGIAIEYQTERYKPLTTADENSLAFRLGLFELDSELNCYWTELYSAHAQGQACFSQSKGIIAGKF